MHCHCPWLFLWSSRAAPFFLFQLKLSPESLRTHPVLPPVWALLCTAEPWCNFKCLDFKLNPLLPLNKQHFLVVVCKDLIAKVPIKYSWIIKQQLCFHQTEISLAVMWFAFWFVIVYSLLCRAGGHSTWCSLLFSVSNPAFLGSDILCC